MKTINKFLLIFIFIFNLHAEEIIYFEYRVDSKFEAGNNIIYDCKKKHFVCVNEESYNNCSDTREEETLKKDLNKFSCIPINKFKSKIECVADNYRLIYHPIKNSLCIKSKADLVE